MWSWGYSRKRSIRVSGSWRTKAALHKTIRKQTSNQSKFPMPTITKLSKISCRWLGWASSSKTPSVIRMMFTTITCQGHRGHIVNHFLSRRHSSSRAPTCNIRQRLIRLARNTANPSLLSSSCKTCRTLTWRKRIISVWDHCKSRVISARTIRASMRPISYHQNASRSAFTEYPRAIWTRISRLQHSSNYKKEANRSWWITILGQSRRTKTAWLWVLVLRSLRS